MCGNWEPRRSRPLAEAGRLGGCLPTAGQRLLVEASLNRGSEAGAAWQKWQSEYGLDNPDEGSYRLLPLVYRNVTAQGGPPQESGPKWGKLKGLHRMAWSRNQVLFGRVRPLLEALRADGTPLLLLKGAALACSVYPDAGCRPMRDVDVMVPAAYARSLVQKLEARGWRAISWRPRAFPESFLRFRHALDLEMPGGSRVDLHWHALNLCCHPSADEEVWRNAVPLEFCGIPLCRCHATEHLLEICVHGIVWNPVPPVRWAVDAMLLLRGPEAVDWERLIRTASRLDIVPYVRGALAFLREDFGAPVPKGVLNELERAPVSRAAAAEFTRECAPLAPRTASEDLLSFYARWRRSLGGAAPWMHACGFARHLQYAFEFESAWSLPAQLARSAARRCLPRRSPETT